MGRNSRVRKAATGLTRKSLDPAGIFKGGKVGGALDVLADPLAGRKKKLGVKPGGASGAFTAGAPSTMSKNSVKGTPSNAGTGGANTGGANPAAKIAQKVVSGGGARDLIGDSAPNIVPQRGTARPGRGRGIGMTNPWSIDQGSGGRDFGGGFANRAFGMGREQRGYGMGAMNQPSFMRGGGNRGYGMGRDQRGYGMGRQDFMAGRGFGGGRPNPYGGGRPNPFAGYERGGPPGFMAGGFGGGRPRDYGKFQGETMPTEFQGTKPSAQNDLVKKQQLAGLKEQVAGMTPRQIEMMSERSSGGGFSQANKKSQSFPNVKKSMKNVATTVATMSDIRMKENISQTGTSPSGIPIYEFNYIGDSNRYSGAMAQDLLEMNIDAVSVGKDGYYRINYNNIDVDMHLIN